MPDRAHFVFLSAAATRAAARQQAEALRRAFGAGLAAAPSDDASASSRCGGCAQEHYAHGGCCSAGRPWIGSWSQQLLGLTAAASLSLRPAARLERLHWGTTPFPGLPAWLQQLLLSWPQEGAGISAAGEPEKCRRPAQAARPAAPAALAVPSGAALVAERPWPLLQAWAAGP
jgi:hypothetical protein